nr:hypothetical protein CFP56_56595 [Quercus suber]
MAPSQLGQMSIANRTSTMFERFSIIILAFTAVLAMLSALVDAATDGTGIVELDLVFPRNETYHAPSLLEPRHFASSVLESFLGGFKWNTRYCFPDPTFEATECNLMLAVRLKMARPLI